MKDQQRLFLAIALTMGILLVWSSLLPQQAPPPAAGPIKISQPIAVKEVIEHEPTTPAQLGPCKLQVGQSTAGLRGVSSDETLLLIDSDPGLLQVELLGPDQISPRFTTQVTPSSVISTAHIPQRGLTIVREISGRRELLCTLRLANDSAQKQKVALRLVAYKPLTLEAQQELQYRAGILLVEGKSHTLPGRLNGRKAYAGSPAWISSQGKSHVIIVGPHPPTGMFHVEQLSNATSPTGWLTLSEVELEPGEITQWQFRFYAGPMALTELKKLGMEEAISFGAFSGIAKLLLTVLNWSKNLFHSYGWAVIFVSFSIWLLFFPLTWSGVRMMKVMSQIQPQVERLRREHAKDPQRMNRELLELYRKHRVNPLSGCLPLIIQMPIFIALFQVLSRSAELKGATFLWIKDLAGPDALIRFPRSLPLLGESLNLLPILMAVGMFYQQRMTSTSTAYMSDEQKMQQKIFKWFPILFSLLFYGLPSGLVLYWVINTALTLTQYALFHRLRPKAQPA